MQTTSLCTRRREFFLKKFYAAELTRELPASTRVVPESTPDESPFGPLQRRTFYPGTLKPASTLA